MVSMNFKTCDKCQGEGWLWWYELDCYDGPAFMNGQDDQKYTCDKCDGCGCYEVGGDDGDLTLV